MNPTIFQCNGNLPPDKYLLGQAKWSFPVYLSVALLVGQPPLEEPAVITLEINGALTDVSVTLLPGTLSITRNITIQRIVPANQTIRWKVTSSSPPETSLRATMITLSVTPATMAQAAVHAPVMSVRWVNGPEVLPMFSYTPAPHAFAETQANISFTRARIVNTGPDESLVISIQGEEVLNLSGGLFAVPGLKVMGAAVDRFSPRLEFLKDQTRLAVLSLDGMVVPRVRQEEPEVLGEDDEGFNSRFEFYDDGLLALTLDERELVGVEDYVET